MSAVPAWLPMVLLRLVNVWRMFQLCWDAWRVRPKTNEGGFRGGVVRMTSSLTTRGYTCGKSPKVDTYPSRLGKHWLLSCLDVGGGFSLGGGGVHVAG